MLGKADSEETKYTDYMENKTACNILCYRDECNINACHYIQEDCTVFTKVVTLTERFYNSAEMFLRVQGQQTSNLTFL